MRFELRYDLRNPPQWRRPFEAYYADFLRQVEWADAHGFARVSLMEHHFVEDGYDPSPLTVAAAIAARTKRIKIKVNVLLLTLRHPVQVAEEIALVDIISGGRIEVVFGAGYRHNEFEGYGVPRKYRPSRMAEGLEIIRRCWTEESFDFQGKHWNLKDVRAMPKPIQKPHPRIVMGGNSEGAARRAAQYADEFAPVRPELLTVFNEERVRLGKPPGLPPPKAGLPRAPLFLHVSRDPATAWKRIAPHARYETDEYGKWTMDDPLIPYKQGVTDEQLRQNYQVVTPEEAVAFGRRLEAAWGANASMSFHPLMGGMPFELGQESLELVVREVMPKFA
ncbi:MAG: LLM class flavin-dependent oxidoreductase [Chloroflexi bacterium]|nr:LLM class flavin-dependent oxidoreductase [Chloroflexota bacterium]